MSLFSFFRRFSRSGDSASKPEDSATQKQAPSSESPKKPSQSPPRRSSDTSMEKPRSHPGAQAAPQAAMKPVAQGAAKPAVQESTKPSGLASAVKGFAVGGGIAATGAAAAEVIASTLAAGSATGAGGSVAGGAAASGTAASTVAAGTTTTGVASSATVASTSATVGTSASTGSMTSALGSVTTAGSATTGSAATATTAATSTVASSSAAATGATTATAATTTSTVTAGAATAGTATTGATLGTATTAASGSAALGGAGAAGSTAVTGAAATTASTATTGVASGAVAGSTAATGAAATTGMASGAATGVATSGISTGTIAAGTAGGAGAVGAGVAVASKGSSSSAASATEAVSTSSSSVAQSIPPVQTTPVTPTVSPEVTTPIQSVPPAQSIPPAGTPTTSTTFPTDTTSTQGTSTQATPTQTTSTTTTSTQTSPTQTTSTETTSTQTTPNQTASTPSQTTSKETTSTQSTQTTSTTTTSTQATPTQTASTETTPTSTTSTTTTPAQTTSIQATSAQPSPAANPNALSNPSRNRPTYESFSDSSALMSFIASKAIYRRNIGTGVPARADPLGLFQLQDDPPAVYASNFNNAPDETGLSTVCYAAQNGSCASCMCANATNKRFGGDSFIVSCTQGDVWDSSQEVAKPLSSGGGLDFLSLLKSNIFLGSFAYERTNFMTASFCTFRNEVVAPIFGAKTLRIGVGLPVVCHLSSYFEEGGGKYVNFYVQKNHAGRKYEVASPRVSIQGSTREGMVTLSTSNQTSSYSALKETANVALALLFIPPFLQKFKTYIHKMRRAEIVLAGATISMRAGKKIREETYAIEQKESQLSLLPALGPPKDFEPYAIKRLKGETTEILDQYMCSSFTMLQKDDDESITHFYVPRSPIRDDDLINSKNVTKGSRVTFYTDHLVLGGQELGPDIFIDHKKQKIALVVGATSPTALRKVHCVEVKDKTISLMIVKGMQAPTSQERKEKLFNHPFLKSRVCAEVVIDDKGIKVVYRGSDASSKIAEIILDASGVTIETQKPIQLETKKNLKVNAKTTLDIKGPPVKVNGASMTAD